jgi:hypothetical protein
MRRWHPLAHFAGDFVCFAYIFCSHFLRFVGIANLPLTTAAALAIMKVQGGEQPPVSKQKGVNPMHSEMTECHCYARCNSPVTSA